MIVSYRKNYAAMNIKIMKISLLTSTLFGCMFFFPQFSQAVEINKNRPLKQTANLTANTAKILYQIDFSQQQNLPQQWRIPGNNPGNISIQNGVLKIDGRENILQPTSILLPSSLEQQQNYRIDVEFSLDQPLNIAKFLIIYHNRSYGILNRF